MVIPNVIVQWSCNDFCYLCNKNKVDGYNVQQYHIASLFPDKS